MGCKLINLIKLINKVNKVNKFSTKSQPHRQASLPTSFVRSGALGILLPSPEHRPLGLTHGRAWKQPDGFTRNAFLLLLPIPSPLPQVNEI